MNRPRTADDFATIRARMEELRRERKAAQVPTSERPRNRPHAPPNMEMGLSDRSAPRRDGSDNLPRRAPR
jgi:hypothetical protein